MYQSRFRTDFSFRFEREESLQTISNPGPCFSSDKNGPGRVESNSPVSWPSILYTKSLIEQATYLIKITLLRNLCAFHGRTSRARIHTAPRRVELSTFRNNYSFCCFHDLITTACSCSTSSSSSCCESASSSGSGGKSCSS